MVPARWRRCVGRVRPIQKKHRQALSHLEQDELLTLEHSTLGGTVGQREGTVDELVRLLSR